MNNENNINYYDWKRNYNNMIYYLPDLMNYLKYGDEKMDKQKFIISETSLIVIS